MGNSTASLNVNSARKFKQPNRDKKQTIEITRKGLIRLFLVLRFFYESVKTINFIRPKN